MAGAGGFLLQQDADELRKQQLDEFNQYADEQERKNKALLQGLLNPGTGPGTQQPPTPAAPPAQTQPAPTPAPQQPVDQVSLMAYLNSPLGSTWGQPQTYGPVAQPAPFMAEQGAAAVPSLPHAEEPATPTDTVPSPGLGQNWKTSFDFGATYTGNYRTNTPHRGVDLVPANGQGIGTEVDAFTPGRVTLVQRDSGAGGLMVYVQDDQGFTHAYMHLASASVKPGDLVQRGQPIATMGESGTEGSPHLHYEVRKNAATGDSTNQLIDPRPYVMGGQQRTPDTTAGLSGGSDLAGRIGDQGQAVLKGAGDIASWLGDQGQKALQAVLVTEGGLTGARGDQGSSAGPLQFFGEEGGRAGQLNNFANAFGMSLAQARDYVTQNPLEAIRWAVGVPSNPGYLGRAILDGLSKNLTGADLATFVQQNAQVSVSPERAGAVWNSLFGGGQPLGGLGQAASTGPFSLPQGPDLSGLVKGSQDLVSQTAASLANIQGLGDQSANQRLIEQRNQDMAAQNQRGFQSVQDMLGQGAQNIQSGFQNLLQAGQDQFRTTQRMSDYPTPERIAAFQQAVPPNDLGNLLETAGGPPGYRPQSFVGDVAVGERQADFVVSKAKENGWNPTPQDEATVRRALQLASPGNVGAALLTGGLGVGGLAGLGASAVGQAAMENAARTVGVPEEYVPLAGLPGALTGPIGLGLATRGVTAAARSQGVRDFLRDERGELNIPFGRQEPEPGRPGEPGVPPGRELALPEPMGTARERPTMGGGTVGITQSPTFLRESLRRMYPGAINKAAVKEGAQNFIDASRGIEGAQATVSIDNTNKTISMLDQGKGMTPEVMEDVFVKLGGSEKPAGAAGGMGTAIKAIMANAEETWVRTIARDPLNPGEFTDSVMHGSGDDFLGGTMHRYYARLGEMPAEELAGAPREILEVGNGPNNTGTLVWTKPMADVEWNPYTLHNWINSFQRTQRLEGQGVNFVIDGQAIGPTEIIRGSPGAIDKAPIYEPHRPTEFLKTISAPGAEIDFYGSPATNETGYANVMLLNNGQYQADQFVQLPGNAKMPYTLVANVRATVDPKAVGYPWTADRNNLIDTVQNAVKTYVSGTLARDLISSENSRVADLIRNSPGIGSSGLRLVDDADIANSGAADVLAAVPGNPAYRKLATVANDLHEALISELEGREIPAPGGAMEIGPSHLIGLAVSEKYLGLNVPPSFTPWADSGNTAKGILIEPWQIWHEVEQSWGGMSRQEQMSRFVDGLVATMLHEISHNTSSSGHDPNFAGILTRVPQFLGSRMHAAIVKNLKQRLEPVWDTLVRDLEDDSRRFRVAARESGLARYGEDVAGGATGPPVGGGNVPLPDQGGPGGGARLGGPLAASTGPPTGPQPPTGLAKKPNARVAQAAQSLAQSLKAIKPNLTQQQIDDATQEWARLQQLGRSAGLPPEVKSPGDLAALHVHLDNLIQAGQPGRDWYIEGARKLMEVVGNDKAEFDKLAQLVGMMARNVDPDQNMNYAIEAWNQWKSGIPVANIHRFSDVSKEAADLLERGIPWDGRKTNSFYINLAEEFDKKLLAMKKVTNDQWINRAYGYHGKSPTDPQYTFMENDIRQIAARMGLRPSQVQAMLWVGQMKLQAPRSRPEANYATAINKRLGQVGLEIDPEVAQAFLDPSGVDIVARTFGGLGGSAFDVPGGAQTRVVGSLTAQNFPGGQQLRPASRATIEAIAAAKAHLTQAPEVRWAQVFPPAKVGDANTVAVDAGRLLSAQEMQDVRAALGNAMAGATPKGTEPLPFALTPTEDGVWLHNTSNMSNTDFHRAVDQALANVEYEGNWQKTRVRADSNRLANDWSAKPDGQEYLDAIRRGSREEAFRSVQDQLGARIADAQRRASARATEQAPAAAAEAGGTGGGAGAPPPGATVQEPGNVPPPPAGGVSDFPQPGGQQLASMGLGAGAGALSDQDEDVPPEERAKRMAMGALAAGILRRPGGQNLLPGVKYALRSVTPSQSTAQAAAAAAGYKTRGQHVAEFISSNLLSGPGLIWNVLNQAGHLGWQPLQRAIEGHPLEALDALSSIVASPEALSRAGAVLGRGTPYAGVGGVQSRPLDKVSVGLRANLAGDALMRTLNENMAGLLEFQRLVREAKATTPQQVQAVLNKNMTQIQDYAQKHGNISALTGGGARTPWIQGVSQAKTDLLGAKGDFWKQAGGLALHTLMPFARVPEEVLYQTFRNAPVLGQVLDAMQFVKAAPGEKAEAGSRMALNAAIAGGIITAALANEVRGATDPEHPNQAHLGNSWVPLTSLGTLGGRMAIVAALVDGVRNPKDPTAESRLATAVNNLGKITAQEFPLFDTMRVVNQLAQGNVTGAAGDLGSQLISGLTPLSGALGAAENITDPYQREPATRGWGNLYEPNLARIPGLAQNIPTKVNQATGEPMLKQSSGIGSLLRIQNEPRTQGPVAQEIARLERAGYPIPNPQNNPETVSYQGSSIPLSREEGQAIAEERGRLINQQLEQYVNSSFWSELTDLQKAQIIARVMGSLDRVGVANLAQRPDFAERYLAGRPENRVRVAP